MIKRISRIFILILACLGAIIVCRFLFLFESPLLDHIEFRESVWGQNIEPYYDETEDIYYLFLPSYVSLNDIQIESPNFIKVDFFDDMSDYGSNLTTDVPLSKNISVTLKNFYQEETCVFQIWECDNLPTVYIETETGSMSSINADKNYEENASVIVIDESGSIEVSDMGTISGRGSGSWGHPKNPYTLKFSDDIDIGPFESVTSLCLLANYADESNIWNAVSYHAGQEIGIPYASPYMCANIYANGDFLGLYGIVTKQEYQKYIESDQIKAVFEMNIIISEDEESFDAEFEDRINIMYGEESEIKPVVGQFETGLRNQDWEQCNSVIDLTSFAKKYAFEEFIANNDLAGGNKYQSNYFYLDGNYVIHCMLPWDYDGSLGSSGTFFNNLQAYELKALRNPDCWFARLLADEDFICEVEYVLQEEYADEYVTGLMQYVINLIEYIETSWQCNNVRWQNEAPYIIWDRASGIDDIYEYIDYFASYFTERLTFLTEYFSNVNDYCLVEFNASPDYCNLFIPMGSDLQNYIGGGEYLKR